MSTRSKEFGCMPGFHRWKRFTEVLYEHRPPHDGGKIPRFVEVVYACQRCPMVQRNRKPV